MEIDFLLGLIRGGNVPLLLISRVLLTVSVTSDIPLSSLVIESKSRLHGQFHLIWEKYLVDSYSYMC